MSSLRPAVSLHALIPAAGTGTRIAGELPKQYLPLGGRPMLWHSVQALLHERVETVFVVLSPSDAWFAAHDWSAFGERLQPLYCGGATRRDSVQHGLVAATDGMEPDDWVLVHDAARPCLPREDLEALIHGVEEDPVGGILALPVIDTVKRVQTDDAGATRIVGTEDRSAFWLAQTPQMFRFGTLLSALHAARGAVTDEASAVEQLGLRPKIIPGSRENIKVTFPEDLGMAGAILARRGVTKGQS